MQHLDGFGRRHLQSFGRSCLIQMPNFRPDSDLLQRRIPLLSPFVQELAQRRRPLLLWNQCHVWCSIGFETLKYWLDYSLNIVLKYFLADMGLAGEVGAWVLADLLAMLYAGVEVI